MLINLSNHPSALWSDLQLAAAHPWGEVMDLPFPGVDPAADASAIEVLARNYLDKITLMLEEKPGPHAVHLMGELTFCFALARLLLRSGITCVASTTRRQVVNESSNQKTSLFQFVQFRSYLPD